MLGENHNMQDPQLLGGGVGCVGCNLLTLMMCAASSQLQPTCDK